MSVKRGQLSETGQKLPIGGGGGGGRTWRPIAAGLPAVAGPVAAAWHGEAAVCRPAWADVAAWGRRCLIGKGNGRRPWQAAPRRTWQTCRPYLINPFDMPPAGRFASVAMTKLIPSATAAAVIHKIAAHMSMPANAPAVHFVTAWVCSYSDEQIERIGVAQIAHAGAWNAAKAIESMKANGTPAVAAFVRENGQAAVDGMADWLERYNRFFGRPVSGGNA